MFLRNRTCSSGVGGAQFTAVPSPVPGLLGDDPPNAATGIVHVTVTPGNNVNVGVEYSLARRHSVVQTDVEAVRSKVFVQAVPSLGDQ
jgi:hypothetical protein